MLNKKKSPITLIILLFTAISLLWPSFSQQSRAESATPELSLPSGMDLNPTRKSSPGGPPVAAAGPDQLVDEKTLVFLDASNSWPLNVSTSLVFWKQLKGPMVQLSNPEDVRPFFIAPEVGPEGAALVFELTLASDEGTLVDTCIVNVSWGNIQPSADAGDDQTTIRGDKVILDGSGSLDVDGKREELIYTWRQTGGPRVVLSDSATVRPSFIAPYSLHPVDTLTFELIVTDQGGLKGCDTTIVNVSPQKTVLEADAGPDKVYDEGSRIVLDGSGSSSQPDQISRYFWTQLQGPPVTLSNPAVVQPTFLTPPVKNFETVNLVFELTITTESGLKASKKTRIRVDDNWFTSFPPGTVVVPLGNQAAIGFEVEKGGRMVDLAPSILPAGLAGQGQKIPYGLFDLKIRTFSPGGETELKVFLPEPAPEGYQWFKCGSETNCSPKPLPTVFSPDRRVFTMTFKDGGPKDEDGLENGMIIDPSGLGGPLLFSLQETGKNRLVHINRIPAESPAQKKAEETADFNMAKLLKLIFRGFGEPPGMTVGHGQESRALAASNVGWNWLTLQFGPAFPLILLGALGFLSILLLKKAVRALLSLRNHP